MHLLAQTQDMIIFYATNQPNEIMLRIMLLTLSASAAMVVSPVSLSQQSCDLNEVNKYNFVFDDFEYIDSSSLFGINEWEREDRSKFDSRSWKSFNWDGLPYTGNTILNGSTLKLEVPSGVPDTVARLPAVVGGFTLGSGTYVTHIKFSDLPSRSEDNDYMMSAFWADSPTTTILNGKKNWSEVDFEWNNWSWRHTPSDSLWGGNSMMGVGNHYQGGAPPLNSWNDTANWHMMNCAAWDGEKNFPMQSCEAERYTSQDGSTKDLSLEDRWMWLIFTVEKGIETSWYLYSPDGEITYYGGASPSADDAANWDETIQTNEYVPVQNMNPVYSMHWQDRVEGTSTDRVWYLETDYFYYSDNIFLKKDGTTGLSEVRSHIDHIRSCFGSRVNTYHETGLDFGVRGSGGFFTAIRPSYDVPPGTAKVVGPEYAMKPDGSGMHHRFRFEAYPSGGPQKIIVWRYKTKDCTGTWSSSWTDINDIIWEFDPSQYYQFSQIKFQAKAIPVDIVTPPNTIGKGKLTYNVPNVSCSSSVQSRSIRAKQLAEDK